MNTAAKMSISHELVWNKDEGRRWVAKWHSWYLNIDTGERSQKFNTLAEARTFLNEIASGRSP